MPYTYIKFEQKEQLAVLVLNRPDKLNALCFAMIEEIAHAISSIDTEKTAALFILGNEKAFSAGGDLKEMQELDQAEAQRRSTFIHQTFVKIHDQDIPVIAFIQGICFGGGLEVALHCDYRICSSNARFAFPEVKYGIIPGAGGTVQLPLQINAADASYYLFTGEEFTADKAYSMQLVQKILPENLFNQEIERQEAYYQKSNRESLKALKDALKQHRKENLEKEYKREANAFAALLFKNGKSGITLNFK